MSTDGGFSFQFDLKTGGITADTLLDEKQARYAWVLTLNRAAETMNAALGRQIKGHMTVRMPAFILPPQQLPAAHRATKKNLVAIAGLADSGRDDSEIRRRRAGILSPFEGGGVKTERPLTPVAIPTKALRPSDDQLVPRSMYPTSLRLVPRTHAFARTRTAGGETGPLQPTSRRIRGLKPGTIRTQLVGKRGTFVLDPATMPGLKPTAWGVYQRLGAGKQNIIMIWAYRHRVRIPNLLAWYAEAEAIAQRDVAVNWQAFYELAMRTAK